MEHVHRRFCRIQKKRILQRHKMPTADGTKPLGGNIRRIRAHKKNLQHRLHVYHMAVSPLAHRERLFNTKTKKFRGEINDDGMGNEK
jgi:hypothetical protein